MKRYFFRPFKINEARKQGTTLELGMANRFGLTSQAEPRGVWQRTPEVCKVVRAYSSDNSTLVCLMCRHLLCARTRGRQCWVRNK